MSASTEQVFDLGRGLTSALLTGIVTGVSFALMMYTGMFTMAARPESPMLDATGRERILANLKTIAGVAAVGATVGLTSQLFHRSATRAGEDLRVYLIQSLLRFPLTASFALVVTTALASPATVLWPLHRLYPVEAADGIVVTVRQEPRVLLGALGMAVGSALVSPYRRR